MFHAALPPPPRPAAAAQSVQPRRLPAPRPLSATSTAKSSRTPASNAPASGSRRWRLRHKSAGPCWEAAPRAAAATTQGAAMSHLLQQCRLVRHQPPWRTPLERRRWLGQRQSWAARWRWLASHMWVLQRGRRAQAAGATGASLSCCGRRKDPATRARVPSGRSGATEGTAGRLVAKGPSPAPSAGSSTPRHAPLEPPAKGRRARPSRTRAPGLKTKRAMRAYGGGRVSGPAARA
mmetsp:Transcript_111090/g.313399  ORF Transcript_111090/g.313399 Transcript_111090/m.313399 type:complete len:235 (+) Transcript_111090:624-1328(+)